MIREPGDLPIVARVAAFVGKRGYAVGGISPQLTAGLMPRCPRPREAEPGFFVFLRRERRAGQAAIGCVNNIEEES